MFSAHAAKCGCATAAPPLAQVLRPPSQRRPRGRTCSLVCPAPANQQAPGTSQRPRTSQVRVRATRPDCRTPPTTHTHTQAQGSGRRAPCERQLMADPVPWRLALGRAAPAVAREVLLASVAAGLWAPATPQRSSRAPGFLGLLTAAWRQPLGPAGGRWRWRLHAARVRVRSSVSTCPLWTGHLPVFEKSGSVPRGS